MGERLTYKRAMALHQREKQTKKPLWFGKKKSENDVCLTK